MSFSDDVNGFFVALDTQLRQLPGWVWLAGAGGLFLIFSFGDTGKKVHKAAARTTRDVAVWGAKQSGELGVLAAKTYIERRAGMPPHPKEGAYPPVSPYPRVRVTDMGPRTSTTAVGHPLYLEGEYTEGPAGSRFRGEKHTGFLASLEAQKAARAGAPAGASDTHKKGNPRKEYKCPECEKVYATRQGRSRHYRMVHSGPIGEMFDFYRSAGSFR